MRPMWNGLRSLSAATTLATLALASLVLVSLAPTAHAQSIEGADGRADAPRLGDGASEMPFRSGSAAASRSIGRMVALDELDTSALMAEDADRGAGPTWKAWNRVGVMRPFDREQAPLRLADSSTAERLPDGTYAWRMDVSSPGAHGLRLRVCACDLPAGAEMYVYDARNPRESYGPFTRQGPLGDGEFLTPTVFSDRVALEIRAPRRIATRRLELAVDGVVHSYREIANPVLGHDHEDATRAGETRAGLGCMNDIACDSDWFADVSRAVATFDFVEGGDQFSCSGTLINDSDDTTEIPYFLTANHCVGSDRVARTVEVYWDYKSATCGGTAPSLSSRPRTVGATLLATRSESDGSLLQLTGTLPSNRFFCGWTADTPSIGDSVIGVHHPEGTQMRISYGRLSQGRESGLHEVTWDDGVTAQGSSGSALFNTNKQIMGDLCCGESFCNRPNDPDYYGRFDVNYASFEPFLGRDAGQGGGGTGGGGGGGTEPPIVDLPTAVANLRSRVRRNGQVILRWRDQAKGEQGYRVEIQSGENWVRLVDKRKNAKRWKHRPGPGDGTHVYRVGPYNGDGTAWSEITVTIGSGAAPGSGDAFDPADDTPAGATLLASPATTAQHTLSRTDTTDWFALDLVAGRTYFLSSTGGGDTVGDLFSADGGTLLAGNDDDPDGFDFNFGFEFTPSASGRYLVRVAAYPFSPDAEYRFSWLER